MKVLMVSAEAAPFAKVGGLADVVGSLPKALGQLGCDARVVVPAYQMILDGPWKISKPIAEFPVRMNDGWYKNAIIRAIDHDGLTVYTVETDEWFQDADRSETIYRPGIDQYLFFSSAVLQMGKRIGWNPQVFHCHDWHTGLIPVMMKHSIWSQNLDASSVFTIHNLAYQGEFDHDILDRLDLPHWLFQPGFMEAYGRVNFLKTGAAFADMVTTVSPNYAKQIQTPEFGAALDGLMKYLSQEGRLTGILNGIDQSVFDPASDGNIPSGYDADDQSGKACCKMELIREAGFLPGPEPILGIVSRMSSQKGLDLLIESAESIVNLGGKLVILGAGEPPILEGLNHLMRRFPGHVTFFEGYRETLASLVYAGSDAFLMPSAFEPCGLGQMIAMRFGTVPIVRKTGGLADTVSEGKSGFVFEDRNHNEFLKAISRFIKIYENKPALWKMRASIMNKDWSWKSGAKKYLDLYRDVANGHVLDNPQSA